MQMASLPNASVHFPLFTLSHALQGPSSLAALLRALLTLGTRRRGRRRRALVRRRLDRRRRDGIHLDLEEAPAA